MSSTRSLWFNFILYPESMPDNTWDLLEDLHVPIAISPCHDSDIASVSDDGEITYKKPHYHGIINFPSLKSIAQVNDVLHPFNCPSAVICLCPSGSLRYHCHLDSPDKHQYSIDDELYFSGFDSTMMFDTSSATYDTYNKLIELAISRNFLSLQNFIQFLKSDFPELYKQFLSGHFGLVIELIKNNSYLEVNKK